MKIMLAAIIVLLSSLSLCGHAVAGDVPPERCVFWNNGEPKELIKYGSGGRLLGKIYYREDGTPEKAERYDVDGRKIAEANYNSDGTLRENPDGWAAMRWFYKDGNLAVESYYAADGHLKERKFYSEAGNLIGRQYDEDDEIEPSEEFNPGPIVGAETDEFFDSFGRLKGEMSVVER